MSIYDDDDEGFGTPYPAARAKRRQASPLPRKNMTTREILEYCLDGYDEDMEPRRIHRNSTLKSDGSTFTLYRDGKPVSSWPAFGPDDVPELEFDGLNLTAVNNGRSLKSWPAMSGKRGYQDRESTAIENIGPLPEGLWQLNPEEMETYSPGKEETNWFSREQPWQGRHQILGKQQNPSRTRSNHRY